MRVGKRMRTETDLGRGSAGVAQAAVELARHLFTRLQDKTVLLVGAGQTARSPPGRCWRAVPRLIVANRTLDRARNLAATLAGPPSISDACEEPIACPVEPGDITGRRRAHPMPCPGHASGDRRG